ncbi:MAG: DUF4123 domain-containing protein [Planctomycetota bacterium]|jgi:hypothetical protein
MSSDKNIIESVRNMLFSAPETNIYTVLDGASVPELPQVLWEHEPEFICLYRGELEPDMAAVAPYLVKLEYDHPFTKLVCEKGWGNHWGIFAITAKEVDLRTVRRHFRRFLMVKDPEGKQIYFRYYDPRVLSVFLPTCNSEELGVVFGPVSSYIMEDGDSPMLLRFGLKDGKLRTEKTSPTELQRISQIKVL